MRDIDVFQQALALPKPWYVRDSVFDPGEKRLDLFVDFDAGGEFAVRNARAPAARRMTPPR